MNINMEKVLDDFLEKLIQSCTVSIDTCIDDDGDDDSGDNDSRLDEF
jgi:hypothetical protein